METKLDKLLNDPQFLADLLNGPCKPVMYRPLFSPKNSWRDKYRPIKPGWIDMKASDVLTEDLRDFIPRTEPIIHKVVAVKDRKALAGVDDRIIVIFLSDSFIAYRGLPRIGCWSLRWFDRGSVEGACLIAPAGRRTIPSCPRNGIYNLRETYNPACRKLVSAFDRYYITTTGGCDYGFKVV